VLHNPYTWEIGMGELKDIANVEKMMPMDYISDDGFGITDACREYLQKTSGVLHAVNSLLLPNGIYAPMRL
jgi:hypothetical protein